MSGKFQIFPGIRSYEDLGAAYIGSPLADIVAIPRERQIDRAEYGRKLAAMEGGIFSPFGYIVPAMSMGGTCYGT